MHYRELGTTGITISEIGFGAWGIGGVVADSRAYGPTDDTVSIKALQTAFDQGITFYDTAALYGYGHSEELIGAAFKGIRQKVVISTKVGYKNFSGERDYSPEYIRSSLEASLKRLQTDYVDVYQLHDPPLDLLENEAILATLNSLKQEGKIRVVGLSTKSPAESLQAVEKFGIKSVQVNFSLVDQRAEEIGLFAACQAQGAGIIARTPLCFGFLTGKYGAGDDYADGDHRKIWKPEQIDCWAQAYRLFTSFLTEAEKQTNAQIALRYVLSFEAVSTTIPGMMTDEHVFENVAASGFGPFPTDVVARFGSIYRENKFFV